MARVDFYTSRVTQLREGRRGKERRGKGRKEERWRKRGKEGRKEEGDGKGEKEWMYSFTLMNTTYTSLVPRPSLWCVYCTEGMGMRLDIHMVQGDRGGEEEMKGGKEREEKR